MPLIDIVRDAAIQAGLSQPSSAASSTDQTAIELMFYANMALADLRAWHDWTALAVSGTITGDGATTEWPVPNDFDRMAKGQAIQRSGASFFRLLGPLNATERNDQIARAGIAPYNVFWFRAGKIVIDPALGAGSVAKFEYQSRNVVRAANGDAKSKFTRDDDTCVLDEDLAALCTAYLWKDAKGVDTTSIYERYRQRAQLLAGRDSSLQPVASGGGEFDLPPFSIPDTIVVS